MSRTRQIMQFGTSRFLQAHVDLFAHEANESGGVPIEITVVKISPDDARAHRVAAFSDPGGFPIKVRGVSNGGTIDQAVQVKSVKSALIADTQWREVVRAFVEDTDIVVSNSGDSGYKTEPGEAVLNENIVPKGFPAKLAALLVARWRRSGRKLSIYPCELVNKNGDTLRSIVAKIAITARAPHEFLTWLKSDVRFVNTLVDRIVSEPIEPVGAVAEPYALWAIEGASQEDAPFLHPSIVVTDDLEQYERLKLHILNLGHTVLADQWLENPQDGLTVFQAMSDAVIRQWLERIFESEVLPGFAALGLGDEAEIYIQTTLDRFCNPFLQHRIADIAQNHGLKVDRRLAAFISWVAQSGSEIKMPMLSAVCKRNGLAK
ncbi:mannitol dehydrogenase family protein [Mesorhizobium sp. SB112]|uniref:mannitol dehydrogenase family protein n=1 Tax=Mesorhizobium sp. SB112 TaxID=3151853 RepID=UPI003265BB77